MELVSLLVSASSPWLLQGQGRGSGELSVKPRGLEHLLGCAHWRRPSGCKRQLRRSSNSEWTSLRAWMAGQFLGPGGLGRGELRRGSTGDYWDFGVPESEGLRAPGPDISVASGQALQHCWKTGQAHRCCVCPADGRKRLSGGGLSGLEGCALASLWKFVRTTQAPRSSSRSWPTLRQWT